MSLKQFSASMLSEIELELQKMVGLVNKPCLLEMHQMLVYHMGWVGEGAGPEASGKRIRPLLVTLCAAAAGGDWRKAIPGAAAVELIHNFSLVHDDIQDQSQTRRGRATLWTLWGVAQAINAGDALFSLGQMAVLGLGQTVSPRVGLNAGHTLQETCLHLTEGQYLDLSYEGRKDLKVEDYWPMVGGKTAALISASTYIGALAAQAEADVCQSYRQFGELLGLAFQAQDDRLGIWGEVELTGKSTASDLLSGKKSLPVLFGLSQSGAFAKRWSRGSLQAEEVPELAAILEAEGGREFVEQETDRLTKQALEALERSQTQGEAGDALRELADYLLQRKA